MEQAVVDRHIESFVCVGFGGVNLEMDKHNRRKFLATGLVAAGATGFGTTSNCSANKFVGDRRGERGFRVAHVTDIHLDGGREAPEGVAAMYRHMFADQGWRPELVLNTGDSVMAVDGGCNGERAELQTRLWREVTMKHCPVPIRSCLGNHDIWSGVGPTEKVPADKKGPHLMVETLGMPGPWYSFDAGGWHFTVLSSAWPKNGSLSPEQFDWLKADLASTPQDHPVCVLSHYPILSVTGAVYGDSCRKGNDNVIPGGWIHADSWAITEVFRRYPNVKLCLSGHMHTCDRCEYRGVWYICGGAVSGAWWNGAEYGFPPLYGQLELFPDGAFRYDFVDYGWKSREWRGKQLDL